MYLLTEEIIFPNPAEADANGLLAIGGDLSANRLMEAYRNGIFPWYNENEPLLWWSPNPRMVLKPEEIKISKSMKSFLKKNKFQVTINKAFDEVINKCAKIKRLDQNDTWITKDMINAYKELNQKGHAISIEVWQEKELVGGLYGIDLKDKKVFCGESMFSLASNASKTALIELAKKLNEKKYKIIDCQMHTNHLESMGAKEINRNVFLNLLK